MPDFAAVSHVSLSVTDAEATARWWQDVFELDFLTRLDGEDGWFAILLELPGNIALEFQQHDANRGERFDPTRTGFDHMGLKVDSRAELDDWQRHFEELEVVHTPTVDRVYDGNDAAVLTFKDPDGIQFEMFWMDGHP